MREVYIDYRAQVTRHFECHVFLMFTITCFGQRTRPSSGSCTNP
jgi:hypothetical protein